MERHHLVNLLFAALLILPDIHAAPQARSLFSWLQGDDEARTEESIIDDYGPLVQVHKYNSVRIEPVDGGPPLLLNSPTPLDSELPLPVSDRHLINRLYRTAHVLPEHDFGFGSYLQPDLQSVSVASIDRVQNALEEGEARIGLLAKTKLIRFLQFVKEQTMKPLRAVYKMKKDLVQTAMNIFHHGTLSAPPPQPVPAEVYFHPLTPTPSETIVVSANPTEFAAPPPPSPAVFVPLPSVHLLPTTEFHPEFSPIKSGSYFEHPVAQEIHENVFKMDKKDLCVGNVKCVNGVPQEVLNMVVPEEIWADHQVTVSPKEFVHQARMNKENFSASPETSTPSTDVERDNEDDSSISSKVVEKRSHKENSSSSSANSTVPIDVKCVEKNGSSNSSSFVQTQTSSSLTLTTSNTTIIPEVTEPNIRSKRGAGLLDLEFFPFNLGTRSPEYVDSQSLPGPSHEEHISSVSGSKHGTGLLDLDFFPFNLETLPSEEPEKAKDESK